ncbi:lasso peptide biosynthesis B2 protein [Methanobacterium sp.]|uniref:lasso peptide biosynthesis B2 protein n=1 Tax=Methanobacterium sp. TaxID=2164 RepID=UPI003C747558
MIRNANFKKFNFGDTYFLFKTLFLLWVVRIMLWILPFSAIQKIVNRITVISDERINYEKSSIEKITWAVIVASKYVPMCTCLTRALTAQVLLARQNYPSIIKLGVTKGSNGQLDAHAWLEVNDKIVLGESDIEYIPILNLGDKIQ